MNALVFFAALAEVQIAVLSVLNLPQQGFPASGPIEHCSVSSTLLFAKEILCDSPTYTAVNSNLRGRRSKGKGKGIRALGRPNSSFPF